MLAVYEVERSFKNSSLCFGDTLSHQTFFDTDTMFNTDDYCSLPNEFETGDLICSYTLKLVE